MPFPGIEPKFSKHSSHVLVIIMTEFSHDFVVKFISHTILRVQAEEILWFLISNFRRVLNLNVCILLGISPASD